MLVKQVEKVGKEKCTQNPNRNFKFAESELASWFHSYLADIIFKDWYELFNLLLLANSNL